ncbi:hypothetical protein ATI61_12273 [Archangium gephyra]|uniref:Lipoprotein n=1 Tax=Archangium gephyra TaxID=48 RepID=A0AAC8TA32_9BACT|nr:hypothetical protein [Archangium gephyra]AKI98529.1 putative lipoprotein [Archangium gephyra]REG20373.1 hypothetical protein ATI61_12273 [Archangium gephyra]
MRLSKLFAAACLSLTLAACGGTESTDESVPPEDLSSVEQRVEPVPLCPPGEQTLYWTEYGACGGCLYLRQPGTPVRKYAACSGNVSGTKSLIGNSCQSGCVLEP